jgi:thiaminase (transcriptional activator TenA)
VSFTGELRDRNDDLFIAFWEHPFLRALHDGSLPGDCVVHYVGQDHQYLTAFIRCYGAGISRSPDRTWMAWFVDQIRFLLEDEQHPHHVLCDAVGISYDSVRQRALAPTAQAYVDHMESCARDTLGVLMAALLPCPWTYVWAGARAMREAPPSPANPFHGWWAFYGADERQGIVDEFRTRVDQLADEAGPAERRRMARAFALGCQYEVRFWDMAWSLEDWRPLPSATGPQAGTLDEDPLLSPLGGDGVPARRHVRR